MYLLDTNTISEVRKGQRCDEGVLEWYSSTDEEELFTSALVLGEIRKGIERKRRQDRRQADILESWLRRLMVTFLDRVLLVDTDVADAWGQLYGIRNVPVVDGLLAATAKVHGLTVVTRNVADFQGLGVNLYNPFSN